MSPYQQKWIDVLRGAGLSGWEINANGDKIFVEMPRITDLKRIRDNLPETPGAISLDINFPKERLKFIFHNGYEKFEFILNPHLKELDQE